MAADTERAPVVVLSPPPTPNGPLHLGHLSGPYLAADISARAAVARGERVLTVCGTDDHQNYVVAKAERLGRKPDEVIDEYRTLIRRALSLAGIDHDVFTAPRGDLAYRSAVRGLLDGMRAAGLVRDATWTMLVCDGCARTLHHGYVSGGCRVCGEAMGGGTCEGCGAFATAADLVEPRCSGCGGEPRPVPHRGPVFALARHRGALTEIWSRASIPPRVRALLARALDHGLPDIPVSYPTDWGIPVDEAAREDERLDVWFEMGLAYLWLIGRHLDPGARTPAELGAAWAGLGGLWPFLGMDNAFYYAALFPAMAAAAGAPLPTTLTGLVVNEFYRLDARKFSTSRGHAIWADELLADQDPALVRLFLAWDRPAPYPSNFTSAAYDAFVRRWTTAPTGLGDGGRRAHSALVEADLDRAERALRPESFDPALAARCLLRPALDDGHLRARRLLGLLTGR
ncbi:class I tRNA ligase family protein [Streptomyces sp. NPDC059063]|uniref:class I tRNA ligase family protein n=1 Tax=unclassified Streptomyces TaxID=2593676 RepID=UPI0036C9806D